MEVVDTEHHLADVDLRQCRRKTQQAGRPPDPDDEHSGRVGVERPGMAHLPRAEQAPATGDDVVRGPAGLLVDDEEAVGLGRPGRSGLIVADAAQCFLDALAGGDRRVGDEAQRRRALQPHLASNGRLQLEAAAPRAPAALRRADEAMKTWHGGDPGRC